MPSDRSWLIPQGTMLDELQMTREKIPRLESLVGCLTAEIADREKEASEAKRRLGQVIGRLTAERDEARAKLHDLERRMSAEHYLDNIHQGLDLAAADGDRTLAALGRSALEALDVLVALRSAIDQRYEALEGEEVGRRGHLRVVAGGEHA